MSPPVNIRIAGYTRCIRCSRRLWLYEQPVAHTMIRGRWVVTGWGPASGECCGLLYVDEYGVAAVYPIEPYCPARWSYSDAPPPLHR